MYLKSCVTSGRWNAIYLNEQKFSLGADRKLGSVKSEVISPLPVSADFATAESVEVPSVSYILCLSEDVE